MDYAISNLTYINIYQTNYYGTNVLTQITSSNIPPVITYSNAYTTNIVSVNAYQQYDNGYYYTYITNYFTNSATLTENVAYQMTNPPVKGPLTPIPTNLPVLLNYQTSTNYNEPGFQVSLITNYFGYLQQPGSLPPGTNFNDGQAIPDPVTGVIYYNYEVISTTNYVTNLFGADISIGDAPTAFFGQYYSTNFYNTNAAVGVFYVTDSIFTNSISTNVFVIGPVTSATNWYVYTNADTASSVEVDFNATNYLDLVGGIVTPIRRPPTGRLWVTPRLPAFRLIPAAISSLPPPMTMPIR